MLHTSFSSSNYVCVGRYGLIFSIYIGREDTAIDATHKKHSTNRYLTFKEIYTGFYGSLCSVVGIIPKYSTFQL